MTQVFWICFFIILYVYAGYPILLGCGVFGRRRPVFTGSFLPTLSVIVPAHNEEKVIQNKLENLLAQDYPKDKLEILVGSDGSTDKTESHVRAYEKLGVRLVVSAAKKGKSAIQNALVVRSTGAILVFTDADCLFPANALRVITTNFADPEVALVTNCAAITNKNETSIVESESLYWRYERWLRREESERGLLAVASGSLFALRRELWRDLDPNVGDDFVLPLQVARSGYRNYMETRVSAQTRISQNEAHSMLRMKMRIISKDLRGLLKNPGCLNPFATGSVAGGLWSHKLLRWAIPYFLIALFVSNLFLAGRLPYRGFLIAQAAFYILALAGLLFGKRHIKFPLSVISSFCLVNLAALMGTLHCVTLRTAGHWKTVR